MNERETGVLDDGAIVLAAIKAANEEADRLAIDLAPETLKELAVMVYKGLERDASSRTADVKRIVEQRSAELIRDCYEDLRESQPSHTFNYYINSGLRRPEISPQRLLKAKKKFCEKFPNFFPFCP